MNPLKTSYVFLKQLIKRILSFFLVITLGPLIILLFLPIYLIRQIVILFAKCDSTLGKTMDIRSTFFGPELTEGQAKITANIVITHIYQGQMTTELAKSWFAPLLLKKTPTGSPKYPELAQYLTKWGGFYFWKKDPTFSLDNHVTILTNQDQPINEQQLANIEREMVQSKFAPKRSPWEFKIITNFTPSYAKDGEVYSIGLFKVHHGLADGYSISKLFLKDIIGLTDLSSVGIPTIPKAPWWSSLFQNIYVFIRAPFDIVGQMTLPADTNYFHPPASERFGNAKYFSASSPTLSLEGLKEIKNCHKVGLKSVVFSAWAGAMRQALAKRGQPIPPVCNMMSPFPMPNHPNKLRNCWSGCMVPFPTGVEDPIQRLKEMERTLQGLKSSTAPLTSFAIQPIIGGLFSGMIKALAQVPLPTGLASDFPGPNKAMSKDGLIVKDVYFSAGNPPGNVGIMFFGTSYNGGWKVKVQVDGAIFRSDVEAQEFVDEVVKQIGILKDAIVV